jgi:hypothetical protein
MKKVEGAAQHEWELSFHLGKAFFGTDHRKGSIDLER